MEKTKIIIRKKLEYQMDYPVPSNIKENMDAIMDMAETIELYYPEMVERSNRTQVNLWCAGSSGSTIASIIATYLLSHDIDTKITYVHKQREDPHCEPMYKAYYTINIIVDDFICSGNTVSRIYNHIKLAYIPADIKDLFSQDEYNTLHMICISGGYSSNVKQLDTKYVVAGNISSCYNDIDKYTKEVFDNQLELQLKA
jgi:hypoxanthine phosphoribosyltransferase